MHKGLKYNIMNILYRSNKLEKQCKNYKDAQKAFNKDVAEKLHSVIILSKMQII